jgi:putative tricarboxylic transport membrane protein
MNPNNKKRRLDTSLIFFICLSIAICVESYKLGIGTVGKPRSGFFPFLMGGSIGVLATTLQLVRIFTKRVTANLNLSVPYKRILPLMASLFVYVFLLDLLGFVIPTFFLVLFFLKAIESLSWKVTGVVAIGIASLTYFIFSFLLRVQLPRGFMGF